jgi:predicted metal-dependent enzyme (double-stranded beta helix superfamily)
MPSQAQKEIASICSEWSDNLSRITTDDACIEYIRKELPKLLVNKELFSKILKSLAEGGEYPNPGKSTMFDNELLLYSDPSRHFSLRLFLWAPGEYTIVHDHNSWGVIGPALGVLEVFNYIREDDGSKEGYAQLIETKRLKCLPKETAFTYRLNEGIHKIGNPTQKTMFSLSVYGNPIQRGYICGYDIQNNTVFKIFSPKTKKKTLALQALADLEE